MDKNSTELIDATQFMTENGPGVSLEGRVLMPAECILEAPVRLVSGYYGIREIGAFARFNNNLIAAHLHSIGRFCAIAADVVITDFDHPVNLVTAHNCAYGWGVVRTIFRH